MPRPAVQLLALLASCASPPSALDTEIQQYQDRAEADCRRKGEADPRVLPAAAQPYCSCVVGAWRSHVTLSEWQAALRLERTGNKEAEWRIFEPHRVHIHSCAQRWLKPALVR
jgi:hypothetical protein